ncbi:MAG: lysylphosphatidylglycerol synthase transmembrane domain-containing protein [Gammaproteobacteria bacterium]
MKLNTTILHYLTWPLAAGLALWIVSRLPADALMQAITQLRSAQWLIWIAINVAVIVLLAGRWQLLSNAMGLSVKLGQLLRIRQAGQLISFVTPGPQFGGEPLQVYWLWKRYGVPGHSALLSVGLDRFYELWINFAILLLAVLALLTTSAIDFVDWQFIAGVLLALLLAMGVLAWVLLTQPQRVRGWIQRLTRPWQHHPRLARLDSHWEQLNESLRALLGQQRPALIAALLVSLLAWLTMIAEFWLLLGFAGIDLGGEQGLTTFVFLFTIVRLAFLLPLPGGIGSVEAALFWAFQALALPLSAAAALIVLMRLRDVAVLLAGAALFPGLHKPLDPAPTHS